MKKTFTIASRKSALARYQAYHVAEVLQAKYPQWEIQFHFRESLGDQNQNDPLWKMPEKGVFTEDFHDGLLKGEFDMVVHSWKDLPTEERQGTALVATLPREDVRDVLLFKKEAISNQPKEVIISTSSPRRIYNLSEGLGDLLPWKVSSFDFQTIRGNIQTRFKKLLEGDGHGLVMAKAALDRMLTTHFEDLQEVKAQLEECMKQVNWMVLPVRLNPPAAAQGALAIEMPVDHPLRREVEAVNCETTYQSVEKERQLLSSWGGGCHQKIGVSVLPKNYGEITLARGEKEDGELIRKKELSSYRPSPLAESHKVVLSSDRWFERVPLNSWQKPEKASAHWVTKEEALPKESEHLVKEAVLWTSGLATWKKLAQRGIWVHGSSESLGEKESPLLEGFCAEGLKWAKWTHKDGVPLPAEYGASLQISTYELRPKGQVPELDDSHKEFFWSSGSSFLEALKHYPWLLEKSHVCGPGSTHDVIFNELKKHSLEKGVRIALDRAQWQNRVDL